MVYSTTQSKTFQLTTAAVLTAVGILIPLIIPARIVIGPASYTLGSHIPLFIACFISPITAIVVALGTTIGFFFGGYPIIIVLRALSHIIFVMTASYILRTQTVNLQDNKQRYLFSFLINILHGLGEVLVVYLFTAVGQSNLDAAFFQSLVWLIGVGTLIHGMVDFELAYHFSNLLVNRTKINFPYLSA